MLRSAGNVCAALGVSLALAGCPAQVGDRCDEDAARTPFYRAGSGEPAYPGQALLLDNCATCHAQGLRMRFGAPVGLEFDPVLVSAGGGDPVEQARRLLRAQAIIHGERDEIYQQVLGGQMPPRGFVPAVSGYVDASGAPMPGIRDPRAHEMLRNWLACGSPVVERTTPAAMPCRADADCPVTRLCDTTSSQCVGVGDVVEPMGSVDCAVQETSWPWIFACIMQTSCAGTACHVGGTAGGLALPDAATAYDNLVMRPPTMGSSCTGQEDYVVPGDPDGSLLVHKLEGVDETGAAVCGLRMPLAGAALDPALVMLVRDWITMGALEM